MGAVRNVDVKSEVVVVVVVVVIQKSDYRTNTLPSARVCHFQNRFLES